MGFNKMNQYFGIFVVDKLKHARTLAGGSLQWSAVAGIIQLAYEEEVKAFTAPVAQPPRKRRSKPICQMTDEEWIAELEATPAYQGIDIKREIGKCQTWFKLRGIEASRVRVLNWLNKAERTVGYDGQGKSSLTPTRPAINPNVAPENWQDKARLVFGDVELPDTWGELGLQIRKEILIKST